MSTKITMAQSGPDSQVGGEEVQVAKGDRLGAGARVAHRLSKRPRT